jgi:hypothetical protein
MSGEPLFQTDPFITVLVLVCLSGLILLLLILEEVGYIYRNDDTFQNQNENENEKNLKLWNFDKGKDTRPIDFTKENPEESTIPKPIGEYTEETLDNKGVKKKIGKLINVYSKIYEISDIELDAILSDIKKKGIEFPYKKATGDNADITDKEQILNRFLTEFVSIINREVIGKGLNLEHQDVFFRVKGYEFKHLDSHKNHNQSIIANPPTFRSFEVIPLDARLDLDDVKRYNQPNDLREYKNKDIDNFSLESNKMFIMIERPGTYQDFTIYANMNMNNIYSGEDSGDKIKINFNTLKVFGMTNKDINKGITGVFSSKMNNNDDKKDSHIPPTYFEGPYKQKFIDDYIRKLAHDKWIGDHKCFVLLNDNVNHEIDGVNNKLFCESYHPEYHQVGVWDAPCQDDRECPYYKANKNYNNSFGSCNKNTGKCDMPFGVNRIGYRRTDKSEPFCYNCGNNANGKCCEEQKNDNSKKSPDYVFKGDLNIRELQIETLRKNGCPSSLLG